MNAWPIALGMTLCDYVIVEERTRKVSLIGSFTGIKMGHLPAVAVPFSVFASLTDGLGDGTVKLVVARLDTKEEVYIQEGPIHFADKLSEVYIHFRLHRCIFPVAGWYNFTLLVDNEWVAQRRVHVYLREENP